MSIPACFQQLSNNPNNSNNFDRGGKNRASERYPIPNKKKNVGNTVGAIDSGVSSSSSQASTDNISSGFQDKENVTPRKATHANSPLSPSR